MDKLPVGQLPDLMSSNNDDEIMVITNSEYNQLKKEKISDFITDLTSTDENNAIVKGTDGKLFTKDFGNASNITEGTLPTSVLPEIPLEKLPVSGVSADTYAYPSSVTVNAQGMVTAIEEGTPSGSNANTDLSNITDAGKEVIRETAGSDYHLTQNQITNCILEAPNGVVTYSGSTFTIKSGLKYLTGIGRNTDGTLLNAKNTLTRDLANNVTYTGNLDGYFVVVNAKAIFLPQTEVYRGDSQPTAVSTNNQIWFDEENNKVYWSTYPTTNWELVNDLIIVGGFTSSGTAITSLTPYQPVELVKKEDFEERLAGKTDWEQAASASAPSKQSISLTPVSGTNYTAPATGWFCLTGNASGGGQQLSISTNNVYYNATSYSNPNHLQVSCFCKKGEQCIVWYNAPNNTSLKFIYAEGEVV